MKRRLWETLISSMLLVASLTAPAFAGPDEDLLEAAFRGDTNKVAQLLKDGADVNTIGSTGGSALVFAVESGKVLMAEILLAYGADLTNHRPGHIPILEVAESSDNEDMIALIQRALDGQRPTLASLEDHILPSASPTPSGPSPAPSDTSTAPSKTKVTPKPATPKKANTAAKKPPLKISKLVVPASDFRRYKIEKVFLQQFNSRIDYLNAGLAANTKDTLIRLAILNESGLDLAQSYPPARNKLASIFSLFKKRLFDGALGKADPFHYYGTRGAFEVQVWNRDLYGFGSDESPEGYDVVEVTVKSWLDRPFDELSRGDFYILDTDGRQIKALDRSDILRGVWDWVYGHGGIDEYSPPRVLLPKSEATFKLLFPHVTSSLPMKFIYIVGSEFMLEVPIWENCSQ